MVDEFLEISNSLPEPQCNLSLTPNSVCIDINAIGPGPGGRAPLPMAAGRGHEAIVWLLVGRDNFNINVNDRDGRTPLSLTESRIRTWEPTGGPNFFFFFYIHITPHYSPNGMAGGPVRPPTQRDKYTLWCTAQAAKLAKPSARGTPTQPWTQVQHVTIGLSQDRQAEHKPDRQTEETEPAKPLDRPKLGLMR